MTDPNPGAPQDALEAPIGESPASEAAAIQPMASTDNASADDASADDASADDASADDSSAANAAGETTDSSHSESWARATRGIALWALLVMALVTYLRLSHGQEWVVGFLGKNTWPMEQRDVLLWQLIAAAFVGGLGAFAFVLFAPKKLDAPTLLERWGWFLSPLILLPAIPVIGLHEVWKGKHEDLLPIVLFMALISERFFTAAITNAPPVVRGWVAELAGFDAKKSGIMPFCRKHGWLLLVIAAALFYGAFMSFYTVRWHDKLGTATFDLGINNNLIYGGLHGKFNQSTIIFPDEPQKYIANHVKLGLYFFLPIYAVVPRPETLLVIQSVSLGLGAIPLFLFARRHVPQWQAAMLSLCYLAYYPMHGANFYEMKMVPTSAALVLTVIYAVDAKRWKLLAITFLMTLLMREDMPVPMAVLGIFLMMTGYRPRAGLAMAAAAIFWFVLIRFKIMMDFGAWWFPNMYEDLWAAPERGFRSVLKTLLSNPSFVLKHIFVEKKFWYLMHLLVPMAFIPMRRWYLWVALVPGAILTLLVTNYDPPVMFSFQYVMHWSPYLFTAAAIALAALAREDRHGRARAAGATLAMVIASTALSYTYGAFPLRDRYMEAGYHKIQFSFSDKERETLAHVRKIVSEIPQDATVASTERIGAHLSSRVGLYTLRRGSHGVDYIVARKSGLRLDRTSDVVRKALKSKEYGLIGRHGEFAVFKRGADTAGNGAILKEWGLKKKPRSKKDRRRNPTRPSKATREAEAKKRAKELKDAANEKEKAKVETKDTAKSATDKAAQGEAE